MKLDWKTLFQFAIRLKYVSPLERLIIISIFWKIDSLSQSYLSKFARAGQSEEEEALCSLAFSEEVMAGEANAFELQQLLEKEGFPMEVIAKLEG